MGCTTLKSRARSGLQSFLWAKQQQLWQASGGSIGVNAALAVPTLLPCVPTGALLLGIWQQAPIPIHLAPEFLALLSALWTRSLTQLYYKIFKPIASVLK